MNAKEIAKTLIIVAVLLTVTFSPLVYSFATISHEYVYSVKTEQVNENEMVTNSSVTFENLSEDEQEMLYEAFRESDHFMSSSETIVSFDTNQQINTLEDWQVVEIRGVPLLVAVESSEKQVKFSSAVAIMLSFLWMIVGLAIAEDIL